MHSLNDTRLLGIFVLLCLACDPSQEQANTHHAPSVEARKHQNEPAEQTRSASEPVAIAMAAEGSLAEPQTLLHLLGTDSYASSGEIAAYQWQVEQPVGSKSTFIPNDTTPDPTFEANVAGEYTFQLTVWDEAGHANAEPMVFRVMVLPKDAIHVELLWHTPNDPDETDEGPEAGADLDLHFVQQDLASTADINNDGQPDPWFDQPFDVFWFNAHPSWGAHLDRDDTDGVGPENLNMSSPTPGATYRVGAHYWNAHGYGQSLATVRIYILQQLVYEAPDVPMNSLDLWDVATIEWNETGVLITPITDENGEAKVLTDYQNPFFIQP